ncbi:MAG: D-alanyl-D-alanine carboxypeptidase/D-alanyl-D-alanine-endopeptidase [Pseudomonadota bacterium]|jgi:D-alanyl-D-alanine carboxypeptidase/D-alanyl-D-alanine-endopeptidase (penicillin-binding protein 4)
MRSIALATALALSSPVLAQNSAVTSPAAILGTAPAGTRFGLLVVDDQGREIIAIRPDDRFIPASNTKLFTTAAAMDLLQNQPAKGVSIGLVPVKRKAANVVLTGNGTLNLSTAPECVSGCLAPLLDQIAAKARVVGDVIADDSAMTDQRWSPGMSWNNIGTDSGTATSALVIDHNELPIVVTPGLAGQQPAVAVSPYYTLINQAVTVADGETRLGIDRPVGGRALRLYGTIKAGAQPWRETMGLDDPADYAAWRVAQGLAERGVKVQGATKTIHRPVGASAKEQAYKPAFAVEAPATPLVEEVSLVNKVSQNLHAELLARRLAFAAPLPDPGKTAPVDSLDQGLAALRAVLARAGLPRSGYDFADGSGMSTYNRISPRATVALLRWTATQPWAAAYRASLPVGGVDGTLRRRFAGTPLAGRIFAKTGTLNATNALSGWMIAASGRELTFSIIANDVPDGTNALVAMDNTLLAIAAQN